MLQKILAIDPQAVHAKSIILNNEFPVLLYVDSFKDARKHVYCLEVFSLLLDRGADLESYSLFNGEKKKTFLTLRKTLENYPTLKSKFIEIIIEKHGEQYFNKLEEEYTKMSTLWSCKIVGKYFLSFFHFFFVFPFLKTYSLFVFLLRGRKNGKEKI